EDGIRIFHVTGVQTCALPILTSRRALATSDPTTTVTVVKPRPRAMTDPSDATTATLESAVVHVGWAFTRMLPFLSATVAAKCSVSPIAVAVSIVGRSRTHAAPRFPMDWCDSDFPITP